MEPEEHGQPLLRKDDFSEDVISQILQKGVSHQKELKVVTHIVHVIEDSTSVAESLGPAVKSCKVCKDVIGRHHIVKKHSYLETCVNPYMCGICGKAFGQGYLLKIHLEVEHGFVEENAYRRSLRNRNKDDEGEKDLKGYKDMVRGQNKENKSDLGKTSGQTPDKTILLSGSDKFGDDIDGGSDGDEESVEKKEKYKNGDLIVINLFTEGGTMPKKPSRTKKPQKNEPGISDKYKCEFCALGFRNQQKRGIHIREIHPDCALKCSICGAEFEERRRLTIHMKSHSRVRPLPKAKEAKKIVPPFCSLCNKRFLHQSGLQIHTQNFHPEQVKGEKQFCCEKCGSMFWTKTALVEHQRIHSDKKQFVCSYCKKGFHRRSDLKSHTKVHTGEKPFPCSHCHRSFRQRLQMVNHVRTHTGEKPYKCDFCEKAFAKRDQFTRHRRVHTLERPYKCNHCKKLFKSKGNLRDHERVHTGAKPFKCKHCDKAFAQVSNQVHHERTHTGDKPYSCPQCNKAFPRSNSLKSHMQSHKKNTSKVNKVPPNLPPNQLNLPPSQANLQLDGPPQQNLQLDGPPQQNPQLDGPPQQNLQLDAPHQQNLHVLQSLQQTVTMASAGEILASMQASLVAGFEDVPGPVATIVSPTASNIVVEGPSFMPRTVMTGYTENQASTACESIAVVLSNMSGYQPLRVSQDNGLATFQ